MNQANIQTPVATTGTEEDIEQAVRDFAMSLTESEEFQAFEIAAQNLRQDTEAQEAIRAFQEKQSSLQMMLMLNAVSPEDRQELERLQKAFIAHPTVAAYLQAQDNLTAVCQTVAQMLNESTGLSFSAACGPGCC
ncbi:MAG: YlbF family regulator [Anaerolineales bacterium]|jgi:cell fate (sporulation/competence/biofilm development) regulator YlbF (YheA/YmcA/DUF963 family)